jgi:hypothetical protein
LGNGTSLEENCLSHKTNLVEKSAKIETPSLPVGTDKAEVVRRILRALSGIEYGSIEIIIQDSKVVQIERTQRSRFPQPLEVPRV